MLRALLLGSCLTVALTGCVINTRHKTIGVANGVVVTGHEQATKYVNTALTGACLVSRLYLCTIQSSQADKAQATEAKAAAVRANAQRDSAAANQDAVRRSSCLIDDGPRLPVSASQCASYGGT